MAAVFKLRKKTEPSLKGLKSEAVVGALKSMEERPWATWHKGYPLTQNGLAHLLTPFGIKTKPIRTGTGEKDVIRGYEINQVLEAERRFVEVETEEEVADPPL